MPNVAFATKDAGGDDGEAGGNEPDDADDADDMVEVKPSSRGCNNFDFCCYGCILVFTSLCTLTFWTPPIRESEFDANGTSAEPPVNEHATLNLRFWTPVSFMLFSCCCGCCYCCFSPLDDEWEADSEDDADGVRLSRASRASKIVQRGSKLALGRGKHRQEKFNLLQRRVQSRLSRASTHVQGRMSRMSRMSRQSMRTSSRASDSARSEGRSQKQSRFSRTPKTLPPKHLPDGLARQLQPVQPAPPVRIQPDVGDVGQMPSPPTSALRRMSTNDARRIAMA